MLENLKTELSQFITDLEKNLQNKKDKSYAKERTEKMMNIVIETINNVIDYEEKKILSVTEEMKQNEIKLENLKKRVDAICQDIYDEEDEEVIIKCPYCGTEFDAEIDEFINEIKCPECQNSIELDWSGNIEDDLNFGCGGSCSDCGGCN